ncbi:hypothetical protein AB7303_06170 [Providencia rettgeri]
MIIYRQWRMKTPSEKCPNFVVQNKMYSVGNNGLAKDLGIHPSKSSRDKARIFELSCMLVSKYGLPPNSVHISDKPTKVVIEGDYAERLIQVLEGKGKVKRKAPTTAIDEAQMELI